MKKQNNKSKFWKIFKIIWLILFILILVWTLFWFSQLPKSNNLGEVVIITIFFVIGIYALAIFIAITISILLIKLIIRLIKKTKQKMKINKK